MRTNRTFRGRRRTRLLCAGLGMPWAIAATPAAAEMRDDFWADPAFDYQSERDVWIDIQVFDLEGAANGNRVVEILEPLDAVKLVERCC